MSQCRMPNDPKDKKKNNLSLQQRIDQLSLCKISLNIKIMRRSQELNGRIKKTPNTMIILPESIMFLLRQPAITFFDRKSSLKAHFPSHKLINLLNQIPAHALEKIQKNIFKSENHVTSSYR